MGLVKTRRLAAMLKRRRGKVRPAPKKNGELWPRSKSPPDGRPGRKDPLAGRLIGSAGL